MLRIYEWNETNFENNGLDILHEATKVCITQEINGDYRLTFEYPITSEKAEQIVENRIVKCEGQLFRINRMERTNNGLVTNKINAMHISYDCKKTHIQEIGNMLGVYPRDVMLKSHANTGFHIMTESEVNALGMAWIDGKIDFLEQSKVTPIDVMNTIIKNAGWGELYIDNYNLAIVKRIGANNGVRLTMDKNLQSISREIDITDMVTRLYPYGQNDLHIGSVNSGKQYIDSPNLSVYGKKEGQRDYNDVTGASTLLSRAQWEFDEDNEERIDVPAINIEAKVIDLSKLAEYGDAEKIRLGDTLMIFDKMTGIKAENSAYKGLAERVIQISWYPYEPEITSVKIGRVKKNLWFYIKGMQSLSVDYNKVSNNNGDVKTNYLAGSVNSDVNNIISENERFSIEGDLLVVKDSNGNIRQKLGNENGKFIFAIRDVNTEDTIYMDESGQVICRVVHTGKAGKPRVEIDGNGIMSYNESNQKEGLWCNYKSDVSGMKFSDLALYFEGDEIFKIYNNLANSISLESNDIPFLTSMGSSTTAQGKWKYNGYEIATQKNVDDLQSWTQDRIDELWKAINNLNSPSGI